MNTPQEQEVDHKDGNGLNNRRYNLRNCTVSENQMNLQLPLRSTTGYKGVSKHKNKFKAQIVKDGKWFHLGTFEFSRDAALAYNAKAREFFGEFARLNNVQ